MTEKPLTRPVRVVEFAGDGSGLAAAYAGWLLARMGAAVCRLQTANCPPDLPDSALTKTICSLAEGKSELRCDASSAALERALVDVDILLCDAPQTFATLAGSFEELQRRLPDLIIGVASPFGLAGTYAKYPATALEAQAISGVLWALGDPAREPLSLPPGIVEQQGGVTLASASLLALQVRDDCGQGRVVDIALADVLASYVAANCRLYIHHGLRWHRNGRRASGSGGAYPYVILPCKDGEVCIFGRTPEEWARLVKVMGNPAWSNEPRYQNLRAMGQQYPDEVDALVMPWLADKTKAELAAIALENNLIMSPLRTIDEVLQTPHFEARKFFTGQTLDDETVRTPQLPFHVTTKRAEHAADVSASLLADGTPLAASGPTPTIEQPLAGMRVVDLGWVWSAPWVSTMLAELGAQVIKVEHAGRPDNLRLSGRVIRNGKKVEGPSKEMSPMYHQVNHGKLGITLNTKKPRAVALLKRLITMSDLIVENMSPGTMERNGLGYDTLRELNPGLVMLSMSAAGQFGPLADMRAYAPNMSSAAGLETLVGYRGEAPIGALGFAFGDPNASAHALCVVMAALRRARLSGEGSYIDVSQIEALISVLRPSIIAGQRAASSSGAAGNSHPDYAPHGVYPALDDDAWLTIAIFDEAGWLALKALHPDASWHADERYSTRAGRVQHAAELDAALASWTATQPRDDLVQRLRAAGVASAPVLSIEEQWRDPHFAARNIKQRVDIPVYGEEELFRAPWCFSDFAPRIETCGPQTGEHNNVVLGDLLGLSEAEINELRDAGVVA
jgi:crotonobetainyl-CoA:carnitine CoA-transferase CaiB-like acyl-CoA transferase